LTIIKVTKPVNIGCVPILPSVLKIYSVRNVYYRFSVLAVISEHSHWHVMGILYAHGMHVARMASCACAKLWRLRSGCAIDAITSFYPCFTSNAR